MKPLPMLRPPPGALHVLAILLLALVLAACVDQAPSDGVEADSTEDILFKSQSDVSGDTPAPDSTRRIVEVDASEYQFTLPDSLPAGLTDFQVTNHGTVDHSFEVEGEGIEGKLEAPMPPGATMSMQVNLRPGTYTVYCPVDDHAEQGMRRELTVYAAPAQ